MVCARKVVRSLRIVCLGHTTVFKAYEVIT